MLTLAEDVLEKLCRLGDTAARDRHDCLDGPLVKLDSLLKTGWRESADDFGHVAYFAVRIRRIFALRRKCQMEIDACL